MGECAQNRVRTVCFYSSERAGDCLREAIAECTRLGMRSRVVIAQAPPAGWLSDVVAAGADDFVVDVRGPSDERALQTLRRLGELGRTGAIARWHMNRQNADELADDGAFLAGPARRLRTAGPAGHVTTKDEAAELADVRLLGHIYRMTAGRAKADVVILPTVADFAERGLVDETRSGRDGFSYYFKATEGDEGGDGRRGAAGHAIGRRAWRGVALGVRRRAGGFPYPRMSRGVLPTGPFEKMALSAPEDVVVGSQRKAPRGTIPLGAQNVAMDERG